MKTIWVVVADEAIARILARPATGGDLRPVEELTDPAAHRSGSDLRRDAVGRRAGGAEAAGPSGSLAAQRGSSTATTSAGEDRQHLEAERFAARVAERLDDGLQHRRFDELRVAAAPRFLGLLRKAVSPAVQAAITLELDKDLIHANLRDIGERLLSDQPG